MMISRRNFLAVAGAAAAAAALTACGGSSSSTSTASSAAASSAASAGSEAAGKITKVALTCDTGTIDDESFNQACFLSNFAFFLPGLRPHSSTALLPATLDGPKPKGSSSSMLRSMKSSGVLAMMTFSSGPPNSNSA